MPDPVLGQATPPPVPEGAADLAHLQAVKKTDGTPAFTPQQILKYKEDQTQTFLRAGIKPAKIEAYWGDGQPHSPEIEAHVANNVRKSGVTVADGVVANIEAAWGASPVGLGLTMARGGDPNKNLAIQPGPGLKNSLAYAIGDQAGSWTTELLGWWGGSVAGASAGAAVPIAGETGAGEVAGGLIGGAAGMGVATQGSREVLVDAYNRGQIHNVSDFINVFAHSALRTSKAGLESAPYALTGPIAGRVLKAGGGKVLATGLGIGGAAAGGVAMGAALNHQMPDADSFVSAAIMMAVAHGAVKLGTMVKGVYKPTPEELIIQHNLQQVYKRNGTLPWDAVNQARDDPGRAQELMQQDVNGNSVAPRLHTSAPKEPPPVEHKAAPEPPMKQAKITPKRAPIVTNFEDLTTALEGGRSGSVSWAGAIGKNQVMPATARQYGYGEGMSQTELIHWLQNDANNDMVHHKIAVDLHERFHGDMNAMLIAYNAGPGTAGKYLTKGPGTELEAIPDKAVRGGIRYETVPSNRDESWLPLETQKYLANGRRRAGGTTEEAGGSTGLTKYPDPNNHAPRDLEAAEGGGAGGGGREPPGEFEDNFEGLPGGPKRQRYTPEEATDEIMANIGEPDKRPSLLSPDTLIRQTLSELHPAENIDRSLLASGELGPKDVGQADMFRQTYASDSRTGAFVKFGILRVGHNEIEIEKGSPSVDTAANEVREDGGNMREWVAYMLAKRTIDKKNQGIKTGFNPDAAEDLTMDRATQEKYERGTATLNKVMTGALEYARDSGYLSQKQVDAMVRDNPAYIAMRRVMGDDASFGTGRGKGFVPREAIREMEGSDRSVIDPIKATLDNMRVLINMADRNRAVGSLIGQVEQGHLQHLGLERLEYDPKATLAEPGSDIFKPYGLEHEDAGETYKPLLAERAQKGLGPNDFTYFREGKPEYWRAKNKALADLVNKSSTPGEVNIYGKAFDTVAKLERAGIVVDPSFPVHVVLRHQITAFIADPQHPPPFITLLSGLSDAITRKGIFPEFVANGGAGAVLQDMDLNLLQHDVESVFEDQGINARIANRMRHPLEAYQWMSERLSVATNIGYYKMAKERGFAPLKAGSMSRQAYLDSAEKAGLGAVNSLAKKVPFLGMKLKGTNQFIKAFRDRPTETAGYAAATVAASQIALYALNYLWDRHIPDERADERYSAIPRWMRLTNWIPPPIAGVRIKFPLPFVIGPLIGGTVNAFMDYFLKSDPHGFDDFAHSVLQDYYPNSFVPTALKTPFEVTSNYNYFTGQPIIPAALEKRNGWMQYTNSTTEPSKAIARLLGPRELNVANFSPIQMEYWLKGWTGDVGMGILKAVNGRLTDYQPPWQMADIPVIGSFFVRNPGLSSQQIEDFYTDLKTMEAAHADWSAALKGGNANEIALASRGPMFGLKILGMTAQSLHTMSAAVVSINKDTTIPAAEKSQKTDQIVSGMIQASIAGSAIMAEMQGKEPSQEFKDMNKDRAWSTILGTQ